MILSLKNIFDIIFKQNELKKYSYRQKQLSTLTQKTEEKSIVETVTGPFLNFPLIRNYDLTKISMRLTMSHWDKHFTPIQYLVTNILLKIIGTVLALLFLRESIAFSAVFFLLFFFIMDYLMNNTLKERREKLFNQFPKYVRDMNGYLSAKMTIVQATEMTILNIGDEWRRLLTNFLTTAKRHGSSAALEELRNATDIFEVRELISIIQLSVDQGTDVTEAFKRQLNLIEEMQDIIYEKKVVKRAMLGQVIQAPLFLALMITFALQIFTGAFSTLGGM